MIFWTYINESYLTFPLHAEILIPRNKRKVSRFKQFKKKWEKIGFGSLANLSEPKDTRYEAERRIELRPFIIRWPVGSWLEAKLKIHVDSCARSKLAPQKTYDVIML